MMRDERYRSIEEDRMVGVTDSHRTSHLFEANIQKDDLFGVSMLSKYFKIGLDCDVRSLADIMIFMFSTSTAVQSQGIRCGMINGVKTSEF